MKFNGLEWAAIVAIFVVFSMIAIALFLSHKHEEAERITRKQARLSCEARACPTPMHAEYVVSYRDPPRCVCAVVPR